MKKEQLRAHLLRQRAEQTLTSQQEKSLQISQRVAQSDAFKQANKVAFYHAVRGEADPSNLSKDSAKLFYLPIITKENSLLFAPVNSDTAFIKNKFSIPEPVYNDADLIPAESLDLVLMPLLGFDQHGNRLGMGGGFYDRCFAFKQDKSIKPLLMGFAFDFQAVNVIKSEPWDIGLELIATESRLLRVKRR